MSHSRTYDAIVLRTFDIGEADRFCALFTREKGKRMARAPAVRKMKSSMGGSLLPFNHVAVQLKEWRDGSFIVSGVDNRGLLGLHRGSVSWFTQAHQGVELLLNLTEDNEPLPEVFKATLDFLMLCGDESGHTLLGYTLRLLHVLGYLPERSSISDVYGLQPADDVFLDRARRGFLTDLPEPESAIRLKRLTEAYLADQVWGPLKAAAVRW